MNMRTTFESSIVRLLTDEHVPMGVGLLVDANHIVTCAHVVSDVLHLGHDTQDIPSQDIQFNFLLTNREYVLTAHVLVWNYSADICILDFYAQLPAGITPQLMLESDRLEDHEFDVYGVPTQYDDGIWTSGKLRRAVSGGYVQIEGTNNFGHFVTPGFSGAPIWDKKLGGIVGIVVAADRDPDRRMGFIIRTKEIRRIWPALPYIDLEQNSKISLPNPLKLESPYGTVPVSSPFYVERRADRDCLSYFSQRSGATVYVQAPRQMGKSSLMLQTLYKIQESQAIRYAFIDFEVFEQKQLVDLDSFLVAFCLVLSKEFDIPEAVEQYWSDKNLLSILKCSDYLTKHILTHVSGSIIIAMDEVEKVLGTPWQDDFFGMLRIWHNARAHKSEYARISLFLSSSTEPELFIKNPNQSPFNVAQKIELEDFSIDEIKTLYQCHNVELSSEQLHTLMELLDGHPFLTRVALYQLTLARFTFDDLIRVAATDDGPFADHLNHLRDRLVQASDLYDAVRQICRGRTLPLNRIYARLKGAGFVKISDNKVNPDNWFYEQFNRIYSHLMGVSIVKRSDTKVIMRNQLYEQYFTKHL